MPNIPDVTDAEGVVAHIDDGSAIIVPIANGEPVSLISALDDRGGSVQQLTVHQMHALHDHPYLHAVHGDRLRHMSYFLSHVTRPAFRAGTIDFVPANFSEIPLVLSRLSQPKVVFAATSLPDRHGYVSLGTSADYVSPFIGQVPFYIEANAQMPRTFGRNQLHLSQVAAWCVTDRALVEVSPKAPDAADLRIGALIAERIPDGATLQAGIGAVPNAVLSLLGPPPRPRLSTPSSSRTARSISSSGVWSRACTRSGNGARWSRRSASVRNGSTTSSTRTR